MRRPGGNGGSVRQWGRRDSVLAIRLLGSAFVLFEGVGSFFAPGVEETKYGVAGEGVQVLIAVVAMMAIIWARWRLAVVATAALAVVAIARSRITGEEIELLFVAAVAVTALARRSHVTVFLVAASAGVAAYWDLGDDRYFATAALIALLIGAAVGALARVLLGIQRSSAERTAADEELTRKTRARIRRELAADLEAVVTTLLADSRRALERLSPDARTADLRVTIEAVSEDSRAAMSRLRTLLAVLDGATENASRRSVEPRSWLTDSRVSWLRGLSLALAFVFGAALALSPRTAPDLDAVGHASYMLGGVLAVVCVGTAIWSRRFSTVAGLAAIGFAIAGPVPRWSGPLALGIFAAFAAGSRRRLPTIVALVTTSAYLGTRTGGIEAMAWDAYYVLVAVVAGVIVGIWTARHVRLLRLDREQAQLLAQERASASADERSAVARELHDLVGHELSLVSLRSLTVEGESDPAALRSALDDIAETVEALQASLDTLVDHLRVTMGSLEAVGPLVAPSDAIESVTETLREHGQLVYASVDPAVDSINPTLQRTLDRILRESATNMMRHAPPGAVCEVALTCEPDAVVLVATNPIGEGRLARSSGKGLRGIAERVRWHSGSVVSGPRHDGLWGLRVELPLDAGLPDPGADVSMLGSRTRGLSAERAQRAGA